MLHDFHIDIFRIFASKPIKYKKMENNEILRHFETLPDHRQSDKVLHPMRNIVFIVLVGAFNGLDGWEEIADFAEYRRDFFEKYLDLSNGFPSDDTLRRFFKALDSK